jgi:transposase-like protein
MTRPLSLGSTIQSKPDFCPACDSREIVKRGVRRNSHRHLQIYWCKDCSKYFLALRGLKGVKYPPRVIARALCLFNLGHSQEEVAQRLSSEHRIAVPRRTISHWLVGYQSITPFGRLRSQARLAFGNRMLRERTLNHQQVYQFKTHVAKLALLEDVISEDAADRLNEYLFCVLTNFPDHLFQEEIPPEDTGEKSDAQSQTAIRSSKSRFETLPFTRTEKHNLANELAAFGLLLAQKNRDRHPSVQDFMLANDSCTVACEVPVYLTPKEVDDYRLQGLFLTIPEFTRPITGHIDLVQVRHGFVHLLDYKPNARLIEPIEQLLIYALAFAARTGLPLKMFRCAWFDEKDYFEFYPLEAVVTRRPRI